MKSFTENLWFEIHRRRGFARMTPDVEKLVTKSGIQEGLCLVSVMDNGASVFMNESEDDLLHDYAIWLEGLAPEAPGSRYHHNQRGKNDADAYFKRQIMGREVVVAITKGKLDLGSAEQILYGEFDGHRRKRVLIKIIGE